MPTATISRVESPADRCPPTAEADAVFSCTDPRLHRDPRCTTSSTCWLDRMLTVTRGMTC